MKFGFSTLKAGVPNHGRSLNARQSIAGRFGICSTRVDNNISVTCSASGVQRSFFLARHTVFDEVWDI